MSKLLHLSSKGDPNHKIEFHFDTDLQNITTHLKGMLVVMVQMLKIVE